MKKAMTLALLLIILGIVLQFRDTIIIQIDSIVNSKREVTIENRNGYYRNYDFKFVQNTDNFSPMNKQDILNIYYTAINSGKSSFTFYCPKEYKKCLKEVEKLAEDQGMLSDINNYVHPFNGFNHIETEYDTLGRVTITIDKSYTEEQIDEINKKIDLLAPTLLNNNLSDKDKIRGIHDYIINNTKYDSDRSDNNIINYYSDIAYGPLFQGYAICGGYTDLMELFLERMNIKSFKISSDKHVWNAVYLDGHWYHLDLTWDDPVTSNHQQLLEHEFFLITDEKLKSLEQTEHDYNHDIYSELKEA